MIRIIGGKYRHRVLKQPSLDTTRCTKDSVREGLFSSLGDSVKDSLFLDLFGGSGACGIEAYSRGADKVYINELDKEAYKIIKENLNSLNIEDINLINKDYLDALSILKQKELAFNIVFLDPPYKMHFDFNCIELLKSYNILKGNHIIILETDYKLDYQEVVDYKINELKYGKTYVYILRSN